MSLVEFVREKVGPNPFEVVATLLGSQVRRLAAAALADLARVVDGGAAPGPGPSWVPLPRGGGEGPAG